MDDSAADSGADAQIGRPSSRLYDSCSRNEGKSASGMKLLRPPPATALATASVSTPRMIPQEVPSQRIYRSCS
eukprot:6193053-Pleurochrysis_carterae.AAC.8